MKIVKYKRAVAMVELIFAMVIIAIVLLSAPMLIHQASKSNNILLQQESIAAISAHTSILLSKHWDEADAKISGGTAISPILKTSSGGVFDFNITNTRQGFGDMPGRLTLHQGATLPASAIGDDLNDRDDIDDYHDKNNTVTLYSNAESTSATTGDYVDINLNIHTTVRYTRDAPLAFNIISTTNNDINQSIIAGTSNIKFVTVHLTSESNVSELNKSIIMNVFSCNIGAISIEGEQK